MTPLERRYRRLLRVLPAWYRASREEEMVDTFLTERADRPDADLDLEYGRPGWPEVWATAALAVRTRFAATRPLGDVVRLIAVVGLLAQFTTAVPGLVSVLHPFERVMLSDVDLAVGLATAAAGVAPIVLLLAGRRTMARAATVLALVPGAIGVAYIPVSAAVALNLPLWLAAVCLLAGFHRETVPLRPVWWRVLLATAGIAVAWLVLGLVLPRTPLLAVITEPMALATWLLLAGGTVWLVRTRDPVVASALAVCAASFVPSQLLLLQLVWLPQTVVQLVVTGAFVLACAAVGLRRVSLARGASAA